IVMTGFWKKTASIAFAGVRIKPLLVAAGAGLVFGSALVGASEFVRPGAGDSPDARSAGLGSTVCKAAWRALNNAFTVPDTPGDISGAPSAATVSMVKPCAGPVFA